VGDSLARASIPGRERQPRQPLHHRLRLRPRLLLRQRHLQL